MGDDQGIHTVGAQHSLHAAMIIVGFIGDDEQVNIKPRKRLRGGPHHFDEADIVKG
ncbi:hypothetical protein D3C71_2031330 [compost metagenome]